jgi:hypothetical protein
VYIETEKNCGDSRLGSNGQGSTMYMIRHLKRWLVFGPQVSIVHALFKEGSLITCLC